MFSTFLDNFEAFDFPLIDLLAASWLLVAPAVVGLSTVRVVLAGLLFPRFNFFRGESVWDVGALVRFLLGDSPFTPRASSISSNGFVSEGTNILANS